MIFLFLAYRHQFFQHALFVIGKCGHEDRIAKPQPRPQGFTFGARPARVLSYLARVFAVLCRGSLKTHQSKVIIRSTS